jgi:hypothetical protein
MGNEAGPEFIPASRSARAKPGGRMPGSVLPLIRARRCAPGYRCYAGVPGMGRYENRLLPTPGAKFVEVDDVGIDA